jgi:hypothetical protein
MSNTKSNRLMESGMILCERHNALRAGCDKFLAATRAANSVWAPHRFKCFMMYCTILRELHFEAADADMKTLHKKFLGCASEPPHFRVQASFTLGVLESHRGNREEAAEKYRQGLIVAREASAEDKARMVVSDKNDAMPVIGPVFLY